MAGTSPKLPLKIRFLIAVQSFILNRSLRSNGTINRQLIKLVDLKTSASPMKAIKGVITTDITVDASRSIWFRIFTPVTTVEMTNVPVVVYYHGGGFALLGPNSKPFDRFCRDLAKEIPAVVISVNYRLAPEHRFPCQCNDGFDSLKYIDDGELNSKFPANVDLSRCFIAGDSAGGNLAHHVVLRASEYELKNVKVKGLIAIQPFFGGEERTESENRFAKVPLVNAKLTDWFWKAYLPEGMNRNHEVVNVFGGKAVDISSLNFPTTLLIVGGFDPLQDWQKMYGDWLKKSGKEVKFIEYRNAIHGFYGYPELSETPLLINEVKEFVDKS